MLLPGESGPDGYVELPFEWPESPAQTCSATTGHTPPHIVELLPKKPWQLASIFGHRIPHRES